MDVEYLILEKQVKEVDEKIQATEKILHADRVIPNWLPPGYGAAVLNIRVPIDYLNDENIDKFQKEIRRLVGIRAKSRQDQAKRRLQLDITQITEIVPS